MGGPIRQPRFFVGLRDDLNTFEQLTAASGSKTVRHVSGNADLLGKDVFFDFSVVASMISRGSLPLPVVFKPNSSAFGRGIVFIEQKGRDVSFKMIRPNPKLLISYKETEEIIQTMRDRNIKGLVVNDDQGHIEIIVESSEETVYSTFEYLWRKMSAITSPDPRYDAGLIEEAVDFVRFKGNVFETRHRFDAQFGSENIRLARFAEEDDMPNRMPGSYAKLGSSPIFPTRIENLGLTTRLPYDRMFDPIFEMFDIPQSRHRAFYDFVEGLITQQALHYGRRLRESGIVLEDMHRGEIDLVWLSPEDERGFPKPVLVESNIIPKKPTENRTFIIQ